MTRVSAGIIHKDGKILICQRGEGRNFAGLWEFPGGKQEAGESAAACLARELQEELSLPIANTRLWCTREWGGITLDFLHCDTDGEPVLTEHAAYAWVAPREMVKYAFCPADTEVARALAVQDPPLKHFLWDFDGTLMDTYPAMVQAFVNACASFGVTVAPERALNLMKNNLGHCIRCLAEENGLTYEELHDAYYREEDAVPDNAVIPLPGIPETLRALYDMGGRHYLVTHRNHRAWDFLAANGLRELFDGGTLSDDNLPRKPQPDMVLAVLARHNIDPATAVMIGDRPLDGESGRNAGILSCMYDIDNRFPDDPSELRCEDARGLVEVLTGEL